MKHSGLVAEARLAAGLYPTAVRTDLLMRLAEALDGTGDETTPQRLGMALCAIQNPDDPRQAWAGVGHEFVADAEKLLALFDVRAK